MGEAFVASALETILYNSKSCHILLWSERYIKLSRHELAGLAGKMCSCNMHRSRDSGNVLESWSIQSACSYYGCFCYLFCGVNSQLFIYHRNGFLNFIAVDIYGSCEILKSTYLMKMYVLSTDFLRKLISPSKRQVSSAKGCCQEEPKQISKQTFLWKSWNWAPKR